MTEHNGGFVYIAGPMQGYPDFNFPAFHKAAAMLRKLGFYVFSPAERDEERYGADIAESPTGDLKDANAKGFSLNEALGADTAWICQHATHLYMLHGWEQSGGAFAEWALAKTLKLKFMYED